MQRGPEHFGEGVSVVFVGDEGDRLVQLGEGRGQLGGVASAAKRKLVVRVNIAS